MRKVLAVIVLALILTLFGTSSFAQAPGATVNIWAGPEELRARGVWASRAWLGVSCEEYRDGQAVIKKVEPYSPAHAAGLREYDTIVAMIRVQQRWDGTYSLDPNDPPFRFSDFPAYCRPGDRVLIVFWRNASEHWFWYKYEPRMTVAILGSR